jgi:POT family proton-dependent oligopeptide transporter
MSQPTTRTAKHPPALYVLFLTEMWERFAFYLINGILLLYLIDTVKGGKGFDIARAGDINGTFGALIWLPLFIGGLIADRYLGYIRSIFIGGSLLAAGYLGLMLPGDTAMFVSMGLIIAGNGFFKPNISTLLGNIYNKDELKPLKDNAYNIFYMGINVGALICNFVAAYLRNRYGWGYAFGAAGVGMIIGLITFGSNLRHVREGNIRKEPAKGDTGLSQLLFYVLIPGIIAAIIGYKVPVWLFHSAISGSQMTDAYFFACVPILAFFLFIYLRARGGDKMRIGALLFIFLISVIFWSVYYQNFNGYTIWAEKYTDRTVTTPVLEKMSDGLGFLQTVKSAPRPDPYFKNMPRDQWPAPGQGLKLVNTELFESIGPFFIVTLTPLVVWFFSWLRRRRKEPTTASKFGIALFLTGVSALLMVLAVYSVPSVYHYKVSPLWLWGTYFIVTVAEIFLSPMGLSLVSKVAPARITSLMMGAWFLTMSLGSKVAGLMTSHWDQFGSKQYFFLILVIASVVGGALIFTRIRSLNRILLESTGEA